MTMKEKNTEDEGEEKQRQWGEHFRKRTGMKKFEYIY